MTAAPTKQHQAITSAPDETDLLEAVIALSKAAGDHLRANILRVLAQDSFAVLELCEVFGVAQPAMSHHLKKLSEAGLVSKRREGTSIFYQRTSTHAASTGTANLIKALFATLDDTPLPASQHKHIDKIHAARVAQSQHFFNHQADALANQETLICDPSVYADSVMELVTTAETLQPPGARQNALEVGPGSGTLLTALAPYFVQVHAVDNAPEMLARTQQAVQTLNNVRLIEGDFQTLTSATRYNLIVAAMVLHHLPAPLLFFEHAARLLRSDGLLLVAELCNHNQEWVKQACGDVWLGFSPIQLEDWATQAGFELQDQEFLAQKNGFRVQVNAYTPCLNRISHNTNNHLEESNNDRL